MSHTTPSPVSYTVRDEIALIAIDHPPVNAMNAAVRMGLLNAIQRAESDSAVQGVLIHGNGRAFIAGADIREFGLPPQDPSLPEVCNAIERCSKPVLAAIHGPALGGGLEIALAAHYRLATPSAKLGLPEIQLGLLPGAGGTQRAPRLIGAAAALQLMLTGQPISASHALRIGLIDHGTLSEAAQAEGLVYLKDLLAQGAQPRRTCDATTALRNQEAQQAAIDAARADVLRKPGLFSPAKIVDAVQAALDLPFEEGLNVERTLFQACIDSPQRQGLIHAFFSEREAAKAPKVGAEQARTIQRAGVIGGGTMGVGIAIAMLNASLHVVLIERDQASLERGQDRLIKTYDALVAKGRMTAQDHASTLQRLSGSMDYASLSDADLVIEAVFEDMAIKREVFQQMDRVCKSGAILATNTSYLDVNQLTQSVTRPQDVIGLHFFSPAHIMKLLEIVVPDQASDATICAAFDFARLLKKVAVRSGVCDGFIGNRILATYRAAADHMMEDGASPYEIDQMVKDFGFPMGPYQMSDLAGGDIGWATRKRKASTRDPRARYVRVADELCERGWFGQKTGRGWYRYDGQNRTPQPDTEVLDIVAVERAKARALPRHFSVDEMRRRYLAAMINEGAKIVEEGIAKRPLDVDVVLVHGYGFPRHLGGPMKYADMVGLPTILDDIRTFASQDRQFWKPSELLIRLVEQGQTFDSLNKG